MCVQTDNRAVTALFRVFGGSGGTCVAEACRHTEFRGMHAGEFLLLAVWIPLAAYVATADWLTRHLGPAAGTLLAIPACFITLNLLPYVLGATSPANQWRMWMGAGMAWAVFHWNAGGIAGLFAWGWIALCGLNLAAFILLVVARSLERVGTPGVVWRFLVMLVLHLVAIAAGWWWGWPWAVAGGAVIAAVFCWAVLRPGNQWLGEVTCRTGDRSIRVTIDDGPDPHDTPVLLDLLDQHRMKAVFFMIGRKVAAHPELAREVLRRGHEIGNHTMNHPQASFWCAGPWRTRREILKCQRVIEKVAGVSPRWFRAPVGHRNLFTHPIAGMLGLRVMAWNRRGFDTLGSDPDKALSRILPKLGPGDIVLVHEGTPVAAEVLSGVLEGIDRAQLRLDHVIP